MSGMETFVVRLTGPAPGVGGSTPSELHGVVDNLRSQQSYAFREGNELLRLLADGLGTAEQAKANGNDREPSRWDDQRHRASDTYIRLEGT